MRLPLCVCYYPSIWGPAQLLPISRSYSPTLGARPIHSSPSTSFTLSRTVEQRFVARHSTEKLICMSLDRLADSSHLFAVPTFGVLHATSLGLQHR